MLEPVLSFADEYAKWLSARVTQAKHGDLVEVSTPILDPFNDGIRVYVEASPTGYVLHDNHLTLETLGDCGIQINSNSRRAKIDGILNSAGLFLVDGRVQTKATQANLMQRMHFLLMGIHRTFDLLLTLRQEPSTDFLEQVCSLLDQNDVGYSKQHMIHGATVEHQIDLTIPLGRGRDRLIKLIGTPSKNAASVVAFMWVDLERAQLDAERVVLLNDEAQNDEGNARRISTETESILMGYSTGIYRWSDRKATEFERLWRRVS